MLRKSLAAHWQIGTLANQHITIMFTALFVLCLLVFGYLIYVLIRPEKF